MSYRDMVIDGGLHIDGGMTIAEAAAMLEQADREHEERMRRPPTGACTHNAGDGPCGREGRRLDPDLGIFRCPDHDPVTP